MKIEFTCNYIGRETAMKQYYKGDVAEFPHAAAIEIIRMGGGKEVPDPVIEAMQEIIEELDELPQVEKKSRKVKHGTDTQ